MADPFHDLITLDTQFRAKDKLSGNEERGMASYVLFMCHEGTYAVALDEVIEIIPDVQCSVLPGVKSWLKGLVHFRGDFLPVTDLQSFIYQLQSDLSNKNRILIVQNGENKFGLLVNSVIGIRHIGDKELRPIKNTHHSVMSDFVENEIILEKKCFPIFEVEKLLSNQRFYQISDLALI